MWDWAYLIPMAGISIPIFAFWFKHQEKLAQMRTETTATATAEKAAQYASQVQKLEDRVRVLERIVTDKGYDVATQIEALRDERKVDAVDNGVSLDALNKERV